MDWIDCDDELPPCDGNYEIKINSIFDVGVAYYDGYGFEWAGCYRNPTHWRPFKNIEKKYGKINKITDWGNPIAY